MGTTERKEREKEQRRHDIIDAAEKVFFSHGYENSTMADIADNAELSKGTIYLYFTNKNELCMAIMIRSLEIFLKLLMKLKSQNITGIDKFYEISKIYQKFSIDFPNYYQNLLSFKTHHHNCASEGRYYRKCSQKLASINQLIMDIIKDGITDGTIRPDVDATSLAYIIWGNQNGILPSYDTNQRNHITTDLSPKLLLDFHFRLLQNSIRSGT